MAKPKIHWSGGSSDLRIGCERERGNRFGSIQHRSWPASVFVERAAASPDHYCAHCAKAARLALAAESAPKPSSRCTSEGCGSHAINPGQSGRDDASDLDLCDVCYWRKRAPEPRPIAEYAGDDPVLGLCCRHGWLTIKPERSKRSGRVIGWLTRCPSEAYVIPTHFLPLPPEAK